MVKLKKIGNVLATAATLTFLGYTAVDADSQTYRITQSTTAVTNGTTLSGVYWVGTGSAGTITLTDGVGGATKLVIGTPADATGTGFIPIPNNGIRFSNALYGVLSNVGSVTFFTK